MLPYELPLIFSNRYFYRFLVKNGIHVNGDKIIWNENVSDGTLQILAFILGANMSNMKVNGYVTCDDSSLKRTFKLFHFRIEYCISQRKVENCH